jgi:macrolide transport system ATP-binding/permease protein
MFDARPLALPGGFAPTRPALRVALRLRDISKWYRLGGKRIRVLKHVDLTLHAGVMVAIVGPSGCGKSTLLNILGCLDRPSAGTYSIGGQDTRSLGSDALARLRRRHFGFIFQRCHLLPRLTARENVEMPAIYAGTPRALRRAHATRLLTDLGLADRLSHLPGELSGGQQQRVAIARALVNGASVILADEPTGALDSETGRATMQSLLGLQAQGHTIVIVTHDRAVAAYAERVIELRDGRIVADTPNPGRTMAEPFAGRRGGLGRGRGSAARSWKARRFFETWAIASQALLAHRLRTALSILGIAIGIAAVVAIKAVGEGGRRHMQETIGALARDVIEFRRGAGWADARASAVHTMTAADLAALGSQPGVDAVSAMSQAALPVRYRNADASSLVSAVSVGYFRVRNIGIAHGRPFGPDEIDRQAQVAVIDQQTRRALFGTAEDPLGKVMIVGNMPCTVIGVTSSASQQILANPGPNVFVPYTTAGVRLFGRTYLDGIVVRTTEGVDSALVERSLSRALSYEHGSQDFFTNNLDTLAKAYASTTRSVSLMLALIASIALAVGGVGIMNIMLVSVAERTREIGIRMASGARRADIARQFLFESVFLCLIGAAAGIGLALASGVVFSLFIKEWRMHFTFGAFAIALGSAVVVGVVFGLAPARKAAGLRPSDALVRE